MDQNINSVNLTEILIFK